MIRSYVIASIIFTQLLSTDVSAEVFVPDLPPGSTYHLAFVTDGVRDATSDQIEVYDAFVNADVDDDGDLAEIDWLALVTTPEVDAVDHAVMKGPVYNLQGTRIAMDAGDFWDGHSRLTRAPSSPGRHVVADVWVGHTWDGREALSRGTTGHSLAMGRVRTMIAKTLNAPFPMGPDPADPLTFRSRNTVSEARLYAVSGPLTVPVPEPDGHLLAMLGCMVLFQGRKMSMRTT